MSVILGSERLLASTALDGRRVGVVCNPASVDGQLRHVADRRAAHPSARLSAIFGPQHGFRSDVQDNLIETRHAHDEVRRVPVYSLYSEVRDSARRFSSRSLDVPPGRGRRRTDRSVPQRATRAVRVEAAAATRRKFLID
jgi:uncharacterized protein YbbC (DUF1343 family)